VSVSQRRLIRETTLLLREANVVDGVEEGWAARAPWRTRFAADRGSMPAQHRLQRRGIQHAVGPEVELVGVAAG
jgi:hypothetical protein